MTEGVEPDFDVIVIGAGIAGCVTAYQLALAGHSVVLIERGETPGSKNLSGGVLYCRSMLEVFPDLLTEAPVERKIHAELRPVPERHLSRRHRLPGRAAGRPHQRGHRPARSSTRGSPRSARRRASS